MEFIFEIIYDFTWNAYEIIKIEQYNLKKFTAPSLFIC